MKISLIISTYNWPEALLLCLKSVLLQTHMPDEIIIPDDGSDQETCELINQIRSEFRCPLKHVWHEDQGFRKTIIHNNAIREQCTGDYLIFIDGDIILERHFIEDHYSMAQNGFFVVGSRTLLNEKLTNQLIKSRSINVNAFSSGVKHRLNALYMPWLGIITQNFRKKDKLYGRGANMAMFFNDFKLINGFNEDMVGWGMEDTDIINRLNNNGLKRKFAKFCAIEYHLFHNERERNEENIGLLDNLIKSNNKRCQHGLER